MRCQLLNGNERSVNLKHVAHMLLSKENQETCTVSPNFTSLIPRKYSLPHLETEGLLQTNKKSLTTKMNIYKSL